MANGAEDLKRMEAEDAGLILEGGRFFRSVVTSVPEFYHGGEKTWGRVEVPAAQAIEEIRDARSRRASNVVNGVPVFRSEPVGNGISFDKTIFYQDL